MKEQVRENSQAKTTEDAYSRKLSVCWGHGLLGSWAVGAGYNRYKAGISTWFYM
jgi:hypothetical protein